MFKIISLRRYNDLKTAEECLMDRLGSEYDDKLKEALKRIEELETEQQACLEAWGRKELVARELSKDIDHYKKLYADELAKRLDLAEKVRVIEEKESMKNECTKI